jgi:hypothetical protein
MKPRRYQWVVTFLMLFLFHASATVLYVDLNSTNPTPPYTNWLTAATNIQDAVDATSDGDQILVTNGIYQTGGRVFSGNRVVVDKAVTVQSVNGPALTVIDGTDGVRCVHLASNAVLAGFTLTNGAAGYSYGGGVFCDSTNTYVLNCVIENSSAEYGGGGAYGGTLDHCTFSGNSGGNAHYPGTGGGAAHSSVLNYCTLSGNSAVWEGGGAESCTMNNCTLAGNVGFNGGGAESSTLNQCTLKGNQAYYNGGGAESSTLFSCTLSNNTASGYKGGGANGGILNHCTLKNNWGNYGGGAADAVLNDCLITGNSSYYGGGVYQSALTNCTVAANTVNFNVSSIAGADSSTLNNCIVYDNAGDNYDSSTLNYCCTTPLPDNGIGNFTDTPVFVDLAGGDFHLQSNSPCINAGNNAYVSTDVDLDGNPRIVGDAVDIGAYEFQSVIPFSATIQADTTYALVGFPLYFTGSTMGGPATTSHWDFGDGTTNNGQLAVWHSWAEAGDSPLVFTAFNDNNPGGVSATVMVHIVTQFIHYVALESTNPVPPYLSWATAATSIQDAVDAAIPGETVLVSNGVYQTGGQLVSGSPTVNRVAATKAIILQSVAGPTVTLIDGAGIARCAYLADGSRLIGFTLTNGFASDNGGGVWSESSSAIVSNCVVISNVASSGGGVYQGTVNNCVLSGNTGGGVSSSTLNNCLLTGNSGFASYADTLNNCTVVGNANGIYASTANNCIIYYNDLQGGVNYSGDSDTGWPVLNYCCTMPYSGGTGNITDVPLFVNLAGGDFHLQTNSPCVNVGNNAYVNSATDLDGNPRIFDGTVDMGAYELRVIVPFTATIQADATNAVFGFSLHFTGSTMGGLATTSHWDFGDGMTADNQLSVSHSWAAAGDYPVVFTAFNDSNPGGVSATVVVHIVTQFIHYVALESTNPVAPYLSWDTAATNIQDAVDAAYVGGTVLVSNGVYQTGERVAYGSQSNRVAVTKPLTIMSVNGPVETIIQGNPVIGDSAVRCVYLTNNATLSGFTLTQGATTTGDGPQQNSGGGVFCESISATVSNCVINSNAAVGGGGGAYGGTLNNCVLCSNTVTYYDYYGSGGGAYNVTLNNCLLYANSANYGAGAADTCTLNNCTIVNNSSGFLSGGCYNVTLNNCIVYYNNGDNYGNSTLNYCCTTSLPDSGTNNISSEPLFVNWPAGDFHLQSDSPCINSGNNAYVNSDVDLDGNPRIVGDSVDIGAYEFQSVIPFSAVIQTDATYALVGFPLYFTGSTMGGPAMTSHWDFGDGTTTDGQLALSHSWAAAGDYPVVFTAFNDSNPGGVSATVVVHIVTQFIHYVALESTNPVAPYLSWDTAATNIQDAVDAAVDGDQILVTNGIYETGGQVVYGSLTNRVAITKAVTVQSVNGSAVTIIQGNPVIGDNAVRCVYLTNNATLSGFTLTQGATTTGDSFQQNSGGGVLCESTNATVTNCIISGNFAVGGGGGVYLGTVDNCILSSNTVTYNWNWYGGSGGGARSSILNNCLLFGNSAGYAGGGADTATLNHCTLGKNSSEWTGGGAENCTLNDCSLTGNSAGNNGGGADSSTLNHCVLTGNSAIGGGGAKVSTLNNCILTGNSAADGGGGGANESTLNNCALTANSTSGYGGGANYYSTLNNCTLTGNASAQAGGGADLSTLNNCIVYYNAAPDGLNYFNSDLNYCCTTPLPDSGTGNLSADPQLADAAHLTAGSPCIGAGSTNYSSGVDIDGEPWLNPPSIGCDEYSSGVATGLLAVAIAADYTNVAVGFTANFVGTISGHASFNVWDFGGGMMVSNQLYVSHSWTMAGDYPVVFTAYNDSNPGGVSATVTVHVVESPVSYVSIDSINPVAPYSSWSTAATNIQDAVDVAYAGGTVWVTNGIYNTGGRVVFGSLTNRVAITKPITVHSVNGASVTAIEGFPTNTDSAIRCVYLANDALLVGFTLTNGATRNGGDGDVDQSGGGVWCESTNVTVSDCVLSGNSANNNGGGARSGVLNNCSLANNTAGSSGGGAIGSVLNGCLLTGNLASGNGGGVEQSTLTDCTFNGNLANNGGGADSSTLNNCRLNGNSATGSGGGVDSSVLNNCALTANATANNGGGAENSTLNNCTLTGNTAGISGGGADGGTLNNCIVYYNNALGGQVNYSSGTLNFCCTTPLPNNGVNNLTAEPQLADAAHLTAGSPCIGAGNMNFSSGVDIDGEAWASPPSMGCDEYHSGATGPLTVVIHADYTNVTAGFVVNFVGTISGHASFNVWVFGDGTIMSNHLYASHSWTMIGDFPVVFTVYNDSNPGGISATVMVHVVTQPVHYVDVACTNPIAPYTSWEMAATNIQDAVDVASVPGALVLVTNGIYAPLLVSKPINIQSVNGSAVTLIDGGGTRRCVYLANDAMLAGFTLTNGSDYVGAGAYCESASEVLSNCVLIGNSASDSGGGACQGTLNSCILSQNSATYFRWPPWGYNGRGGGAYNCTLNNCTLSGNLAYEGGGADNCTLNGCTLDGNSALVFSNPGVGDPGGDGGGMCYGTASNCTLSGNTADYGGGANNCLLINCTLSVNSAYEGGGAGNSTLQTCVLSNNTAGLVGGGAVLSVLNQCTLSGNSSSYGGAACGGTLNFCTLTNNTASIGGGAATWWYPSTILNNCILVGNSATDTGGGADSAMLNNCVIANNSAANGGGGTSYGTLNNCTLTGNSAGNSGGGVYNSTLNNCIVYRNTVPDGLNYFNSDLNYCCTTPLPDSGTGNITNEPVLVNPAGNDFHLQSNSPCINSGNNSFVVITNDLDGNPRIQGGTVDIGAYEYQTPTSVISYAWLQQYGLLTDGTADYADTDGDGFSNWNEWRAGTSPTNPSSLLKMTTVTNDVSGITITWQSVSGITYFLQRGTNLMAQPAFSTIQTDIAGQAGTTSYTDTTATNGGPYFYRVGVQ